MGATRNLRVPEQDCDFPASAMLVAGVWPPREGMEPRNPHQGSGWGKSLRNFSEVGSPHLFPLTVLGNFPKTSWGAKIKKYGPQEERLHPPQPR